MAMRKLKLPDGGSMDIPLPAGFGDSELAASTQAGRTTMYVVGTVAGAVAGFLIILVASQISDAIENK